MKRQLSTIITASRCQLTVKGFSIHTDAHGRNLQRPTEDLIPKENIAVQIPVIIVRRTAAMGLAGTKLAANLHNAGRVVFPHKGNLSLITRQIRIHIFELLSGNKNNFPA